MDDPSPTDMSTYSYMDLVSKAMRNERDRGKYMIFSKELKRYTDNIDAGNPSPDTYERMKEIMEGHPELILGLKVFLAKMRLIHMDLARQLAASNRSAASSSVIRQYGQEGYSKDYVFMLKFKARFQKSNPEVYGEFLNLMSDLCDSKISYSDLYLQLRSLCHDNDADSLFDEFPTDQYSEVEKKNLGIPVHGEHVRH